MTYNVVSIEDQFDEQGERDHEDEEEKHGDDQDQQEFEMGVGVVEVLGVGLNEVDAGDGGLTGQLHKALHYVGLEVDEDVQKRRVHQGPIEPEDSEQHGQPDGQVEEEQNEDRDQHCPDHPEVDDVHRVLHLQQEAVLRVAHLRTRIPNCVHQTCKRIRQLHLETR